MNPELAESKPVEVKEGETVKELIKKIQTTVESVENSSKKILPPPEEGETQNFGLVHISSKYNKNMKMIDWMDENAAVSTFGINQFDIVAFRNKSEIAPTTLSSTIDTTTPSIRLIIVKPNAPEANDDLDKSTHDSGTIELEPGEVEFLKITKVCCLSDAFGDTAVIGTLRITNFQLNFSSDKITDSYWKKYFSVPLMLISEVDREKKENAKVMHLTIFCKDFREITFAMVVDSAAKVFFKRLKELCFFDYKSKKLAKVDLEGSRRKNSSFILPEKKKKTNVFFAFEYAPASLVTQEESNGWKIFTMEKEYNRMFGAATKPTWRLSSVNDKWAMSDTYPEKLIVPTNITDEELIAAATFRSKGRISVLSYYHASNGCTITRASQPMVGIKRLRNATDEKLIQAIREVSEAKMLYIFDARPRNNAMANIPMGGGYESATCYPQTELVFLNIHNIHIMRESLARLQAVVRNQVSPLASHAKFYSELEASGWLEHIRLILEGTAKIVSTIDSGNSSAFVHCSDGWDRTAQLAALAQVCLDPYYRTIRGFAVLIEKEWVAFGHKFQDRIGHGERNGSSEDTSPVFLQFMDAVYQLTMQRPCEFEWTEKLLIFILDQLYSCKYGTFLCNSEKERDQQNVKTKTVSLWAHVLSQVDMFSNPFFVPSNGTIFPSFKMMDVVLWKSYYGRWYVQKGDRKMTAEFRGMYFQNVIASQSERLKALEQELTTLKLKDDAKQEQPPK